MQMTGAGAGLFCGLLEWLERTSAFACAARDIGNAGGDCIEVGVVIRGRTRESERARAARLTWTADHGEFDRRGRISAGSVEIRVRHDHVRDDRVGRTPVLSARAIQSARWSSPLALPSSSRRLSWCDFVRATAVMPFTKS